MIWLWIGAGALLLLLSAALVITYICFRLAFYAPDREPEKIGVGDLPEGEVYDPFKEQMEKWLQQTKGMTFQEYSITSFDGLRLFGRFYEYEKGAPIELMFHGYRGTALRDLSGGVQRCFALKRSAFIVDQRASEKSGGNVISFGVNEHRDCLLWVDFLIKLLGPDVKIILTGISMGASTVLMAAGHPLPKNVVGVIADCGYSSQRDIIKKTIRDMGLPVEPGYFFAKLGARIFGKFDLDGYTPLDGVKRCKVPVIFFHGEDDSFVPCDMSRENYAACASDKRLVTVKGAGHGLAFPVDPDGYIAHLEDFWENYMSKL